ncbi:BURP domain-containing protein 17-like [Humulus lupulus]|uniref:BURP domain-containing protein 17-like n=1 Tax=Humulus lupulus TaxID=3486 RepID=UPI002B40F158|nr:BURP domain-containing protein 17-like [Humulus lupulus]
MVFHFPYIFLAFFTTLVFAVSHGTKYYSPELYWKTVLPNTPMPKAVSDLLIHNPKAAHNRAKPPPLPPLPPYKPAQLPAITLPPILVLTTYAVSSETKLLHQNPNPNVALFFLEKDIQPGTKLLDLDFIKSSNKAATFLPRQQAQSIPFSSKKVPEILNQLSVKPHSAEAAMVKQTIEECEARSSIRGEEKYCATSLESMIDFTTSKLGKNLQAISTQVENDHSAMHNCTITQVEKKRNSAGSGVRTVACHKQNYPFAVFYCHTTQATETYVVSLVGGDDDGTKAEAVVACHKDTSQWNPNHLAFQMLKVKPGTVPICHFLPEDHIVWIQN